MLVEVRGEFASGFAKVRKSFDNSYDIEYFVVESNNGGNVHIKGSELNKVTKYGFDPVEIRMRIEEEFDSLS